MALIRVTAIEDFVRAADANATPTSHIVITDGITYVWLVPAVTSQHRHYIYYEGGEDEVKKLLSILSSKGFKVVHGTVELGKW
jgi:hypothetical protein